MEDSVVKALRALTVVLGVAAVLLVLPAGAYAAGNPSAMSTAATVGVVPQATVRGCPSGWFCFYKDANFGGPRLQSQQCGLLNLTTFGFNDQISSWVNNTSSSVDVFGDINGRGVLLWHEPPFSRSSFVGPAANDQASSVRHNC